MYKVIHYFTDLQDNCRPYNVGDVFPREGMEVTEARLAELAGSDNMQKKPLIEKVEEPVKKPAKRTTKKAAAK
jgi:hypothetical protein